MPEPTVIRCAVPDCDWGFTITEFGVMDKCYEAFRLHCIQMHAASEEPRIGFDLEKLLLFLEKR